LQIEFSRAVQAVTDATGKELSAVEIWNLFEREYLRQEGGYEYRSHQLTTAQDGSDGERLTVKLNCHGQGAVLSGRGNGPIDALIDALGLRCDVLSFEERSMGSGSDARAVAFVEITTPSRVTLFGCGVHGNIVSASLLAVLSAVNRALRVGAIDDAMPMAGNIRG
jgi:2-isopropylmalate synthase